LRPEHLARFVKRFLIQFGARRQNGLVATQWKRVTETLWCAQEHDDHDDNGRNYSSSHGRAFLQGRCQQTAIKQPHLRCLKHCRASRRLQGLSGVGFKRWLFEVQQSRGILQLQHEFFGRDAQAVRVDTAQFADIDHGFQFFDTALHFLVDLTVA
jgi:hypothetical protein